MPARWEQISRIYNAAVSVEEKNRASFLDEACGDDTELRKEVQSLLVRDEQASLLEVPALRLIAKAMAKTQTQSIAGKEVGSYKIDSLLGVGGMGEVYRARDTKLNREVAIKVLSSAFVQDSDRLTRFQREARVLASLNHPNIGAIYGLEEKDGVQYLVLELVPGETLAQRLESRRLAVREALEICRQIAEALEAAHEKGIIHRDLKPANVKITSEGKVKVLDFGLAKVLEPDLSAKEFSEASTLTAATSPGMVLGTVGYMSPEQACGKPLDRRTDVWSFGCVLYECLARKQPFSGGTVQEVLGRILEKEPDWKALPEGVSENIRCLLRRALQKEAYCRLRDIGDARIELEETISGRITTPTDLPDRARARKKILVGSLAMALLAAAAAGGLAWHSGRRSVPAPPVTRFTVPLPDTQQIVTSINPGIMFSRDGRILTFNSPKLGYWLAYQRALDDLEVKPLLGIKHLSAPCFSPDNKWVVLIDNATIQLKKVALSGGAPMVLTDVDMWSRGDWGRDGYIYFTERYPGSIHRIPENGGKKELVTTLDAKKQEFSHKHAQILPRGDAIIFAVVTAGVESYNDARIEVQRLDTEQRKTLVEGGFCPRYSPSGHIVYARDGSLYAVPFDAGRLEVTGPPMKVVDGVLMSTNSGAAYYDISSTGSLAYAEGKAEGGERILVDCNR